MKRAVVICPGRGSYTKDTLGYLRKFGASISEFIEDIDSRRASLGEPTITELDSAETFKPQVHTKGEHASPLIYACAYADFMSLDREKYEVVAICGNSMGWYLTLAFGGSLSWAGGFDVVQTMGGMMRNEIIGGQVIYPIIDADWKIDPRQVALVEQALATVNAEPGHQVCHSIHLGGYAVLGGNKEGIQALLKILPKQENYPFQLINHAAFHTPLLEETSLKGKELLSPDLFSSPSTPLIDGRGHIWMPYSTDTHELWDYTLGHQVTQVYDFSLSVTVAIKEFAPDTLILLGPGNSLGGAIGQIMIANDWHGLKTKSAFSERQARDPLLISLGRE